MSVYPTPLGDLPEDVVAEFPLTSTQTRCWFLDRMNPGNPSLNVAVRWEVRGTVQAASLEAAFQTVIARHEILRTRFVDRDGTPVQQVVDAVPFKLDLVDIRAIPEDRQTGRIEEIAHEVAERPFDLGQAGLIRATLARLSATRAILIYVVHQSCFDGASIRVLGNEIGTAAQAFETGTRPELPDLPLQYGDFALWQADYHRSGVLDEAEAYWRDALCDMTYFEVDPDRSRPARKGTEVDQVTLDLPAGFEIRLTRTAKSLGVSPFALGTAVFSACLHRATGQTDVSFGTQIAGRNDSDLDNLIGVFINNLVLRVQTRGDTTLSAHVAKAKAVVEQGLVNQAMPFNRLVEALNPPRDPSRTPLIAINFNLQHVFMESRAYGGFELVSTRSHAPGAIYDLDLAVMGRPTGWQMMLDYSSALYDRATVQGLLELVRDGFALLFDNPEAPVSAIPLPAALQDRGAADRRETQRIEHLLSASPLVGEAAAVRVEGGFHAFVTPGDTGLMTLDALPQAIADEIDGLGTTGLSVLAALPRNSRGAVNRAVLRPPAAARPARPRAVDASLLAALRSEWCEVLKIDTVSPAATFFDLGGHSVLVLKLLTRVRALWNVELDIATVYEHATLPALAQQIALRLEDRAQGRSRDENWRIIRLERSGDLQPLLSVNNAVTALAVAKFGPRPTSVLRVNDGERGIDLRERPFEDIAALYADLAQEAQPDGPFLFYGNCVHGNMALETARHLLARGETVAGVVMSDVWEPGYTAALDRTPRMKWAEKLHALRNRWRMVRQGEIRLATMLSFYGVVRKSRILDAAARIRLIEPAFSPLEEQQGAFVEYLSRMRDRYRPAPIGFPVLHLVTDITPRFQGFSPSIGWENIVEPEKLRTIHIPRIRAGSEPKLGLDALSRAMAEFLGET